MSKQGERIAARMADTILMESGSISKAYGTRQEIISMISPVAEAIAMLEKAARKYDRSFARLAEAQGRHLDQLAPPQPGFASYRPEEFELVRRRAMNGHQFTPPDKSGAPAWHPEAS
jgi:hypothetical protein